MRLSWNVFRHRPSIIAAFGLLVAVVALGLWFRAMHKTREPSSASLESATPVSQTTETASNLIEFPRESWDAAGIKFEPVQIAPLSQSLQLTGKIALNEDRLAHIFPLVHGRVNEVKVQLGKKVNKGDLLVVVQSTEVGRLVLQLFQDRLQRDFALTKDRWTQMVATNTQAMIKLMRSGDSIEEIEKQLTDRPMGDYRDKLMSTYVAYYKAKKNLDRLVPLSEGGTITGKQLLEAESEWNAARASLQSLLEQLTQETQQTATISTQSVKELETRVAIDETNLKILGVEAESLKSIDPAKQGESVSHYPIQSPFDGTIISKDVVLLERVGPDNQILSIADLSTVWVTTDIYEENLPLLAKLENRKIQVTSPAWPDKTFSATIFYTGDLVHESSRTVAMRAIADNDEGKLKPGMFVNVILPDDSTRDVMQVPHSAVLEHAGKSFVFVHLKDDQFERRDVTLGGRNEASVEISTGLSAKDEVVVRGGFALKSRMLAELLSE